MCHNCIQSGEQEPSLGRSTDLCLVQGLQSLLVVPLKIFQLLKGLFLLLQGLHVNLLTLHLRKELIHCLSDRVRGDSYYIYARGLNSHCIY